MKRKYIQSAESDYVRVGNMMFPKDASEYGYASAEQISEKTKRKYQAELDAKAAEEKRIADIARGRLNYQMTVSQVDPSLSVDDQLNAMFDNCVPAEGKCDNIGAELIRAINRLGYRWNNDGDRFYEGYGLETCGGDAAFIIDFTEGSDIPEWMYDMVERGAEPDDLYDEHLKVLEERVLNYVRNNPQLFGQDTPDSREYSSDTLDEIKEMSPKYEFEPDVYELWDFVSREKIDDSDIKNWLDSLAEYDFGGEVRQWARDGFIVEDLDKEQLQEWESRYSEALEYYLEELRGEFPEDEDEDEEYEDEEYEDEEDSDF